MTLSLSPPIEPMLGKLARDLPEGNHRFEPKWDGFRCLAFRDGGEVDLRSRHGRPLARYFPELEGALEALAEDRWVIDGEIVLVKDGRFDFPTLLSRLHPAESRARRLARETPAAFVAFDLLAVGGRYLMGEGFAARRRELEVLLREARPPLHLTPSTEDRDEARAWLRRYQGIGIDGVVAKHPDLRYQPGVRAMVKVKTERTADCVVAGFRWFVDRPLLSSLLLGLFDRAGELRHVGVVTSFTRERRLELIEELRPYAVPLQGHPWERGFLTGGSPVGRLAGAAGRWSPEEMELDWVPLSPELVCEVAFDHLDRDRFRHPARFRRWRPDRDPRSCTFDQLEPDVEAPPPLPLAT